MSLQQLLENTDSFKDTNNLYHLRVSHGKTMCLLTFKSLPSPHVSDCRRDQSINFVVSVVSAVSVVRKKFIGQIEFILSPTTSCIYRFFCIEHLYGRFP